MTSFSYQPAGGRRMLALVDSGTLLVVHAPDARAAMRAWELVSGASEAPDILAGLTADGLAETPSFVLAFGDADGVNVVVFGEAGATLETDEGRREVAPSAVSRWGEASAPGGARVRVGSLGDAVPGDTALPLGSGAAWVSGVHADFADAAEAGDASEASAPAETPDDDLEATRLPEDTVYAASPGEPFATTPEAEEAVGDHDGLTVLASDVEALRRPADASTGDDATPPTQAYTIARYALELPGGERHDLDAPVIVGRAPSVSNVPASDLPRLITVPGDDISRSHVRLAVEGDLVVVTDLRSSNGTVVIAPGGPPQQLRGGESVPVIAGTVIDLGSGTTLRVLEA